MIIRRLSGAFLMSVGGLAVLGMATIASVVIANYVEWDNAADALGTVAQLSALPVLGGTVVALIGRWVYGDWSGRAPLMRVSTLAIRLVGMAMALGLGAMLLFLFFAGIGPDDRDTAVSLGVGVIGGIMLTAIGFWIAPRDQPKG